MNSMRHPIFSCEAAADFEARYFGGDEARERQAMQLAGRRVAEGIFEDWKELGDWSAAPRLLVLAGKGHNAGDALIAAGHLARLVPGLKIDVRFVFGARVLRPLAAEVWRDLARSPSVAEIVKYPKCGYDVVIDGVFGFQFKAPMSEAVASELARVNALPVRLRASVDLPSGLAEPQAFQADFTYATGIVKSPLLGLPNAGRVRYLDLGFFDGKSPRDAKDYVLTDGVLASLRKLRPALGDKRTYGHLVLLGGSRSYPGAILMSARAALAAGAGLVTAFVPESCAMAYAAQVPEVMWVGWPETPDGGLALEGLHLWHERQSRATAMLVGPGLSREPECLALAAELVRQSTIPMIIDADALQPKIVSSGRAPRILTPHAGEYERIVDAIPPDAVVVRKGPQTRVVCGEENAWSFFGGPVLSRGGSGDLLAGLIGGLLAGRPSTPVDAAIMGTVWHGRAADELARARGQISVHITQLLDFLPCVLRNAGNGGTK